MYEKGSEWRKWDLHAHTPLDHEWINRPQLNTEQQKQAFAKEYIDFAKAQHLSVIGIVDHNFCNSLEQSLLPYLINEANQNSITILPGFEITAKDGSGIHILVLFKENTELSKIFDIVKACFPPATELCPTSGVPVSQYGITEIKNIIDSSKLDSILIFAHADSKSGVLDKDTITRTRRVEEWNNKDINICQLSKAINDFNIGTFLSNVFQGSDVLYKRNMAYITASDCRCILESDCTEGRFYLGQKFSWIKANPTFEGLKQIIYEPDLRVIIQEENPCKNYLKPFFSEIEVVNHIDVFANNRLHIDSTSIKLNRDLVAIIGGRGSGKSILLDLILKSFKNNENEFSNNSRVKDIVSSSLLKLKYTKSDNNINEYIMSDVNYLDYVHISQGEVKRIIEKSEEFSQEIFKMLSISPKIDTDLLIEIGNKLNIYLALIEGKDKYNITNLNQEKEKFEKFIQDLKTEENRLLIEEFQKNETMKISINNLLHENNDYIATLNNIESSINEKLEKTRVSLSEVLDDKINFTNVTLKTQRDELNQYNNSLKEKLVTLEKENQNIKHKFVEAGFNQDINTLTSQLISFEQQLSKYKTEISQYHELNTKIQQAKNNVDAIIVDFKNSLESKQIEILQKWESLKLSEQSAQQEIKDTLSANILLNSDMSINLDKLYSIFSNHINGQKYRTAGGKTKEERIKEEILNINNVDEFFNFLNGEAVLNVWQDEKVSVFDFIENTYSIDDIFYDMNNKRNLIKAIIDNLSHIVTLSATIRVQDGHVQKTINELSAGMKGTLYTKVKLLTNTFETPVIFDQPEDDLDNDFIMNNMVTLFRKLKQYRQIIIVTHNPNLVINADAEQVIIAQNNNEHISYKSGAIEDSAIRDSICQILEGGATAFKNREKKYNI